MRCSALALFVGCLMLGCRSGDHVEEPGASAPASQPPPSLTIDRLVWSDDPSFVASDSFGDHGVQLLGHVADYDGYPKLKAFTASADRTFFLEAPGHPSIQMQTAVGGVTYSTDSVGSDGVGYVVFFPTAEPMRLTPGLVYALRARNLVTGFTWETTNATVTR